jgi:hypothetical protein
MGNLLEQHRNQLILVIKVDNMNKKGFDISSIARFAGMSNSTLHHVFEKIIRQSPTQNSKKKNPASPATPDGRQQRLER